MRILVVEDEAKVARAIAEGLIAERYDVEVAATGEDAFDRLASAPFDVVVLDLMLPGRDGLELLTMLRARGIATPVLVLTARDTVADRVRGLDSGADDYLVKPFAFAELSARIRALARRGRPESAARFQVGDLVMDCITRRVTRAGRRIELTGREYEILEYLFRHRHQIVSREMLAHDVWHETARATPLDNVIDVNMARLRKKVDAGDGPRLIHTVRGVGFVLREGDA
jgi:two-component system copper resistance phosphate regulon response regulator CusR